jgi:hypothetical protein
MDFAQAKYSAISARGSYMNQDQSHPEDSGAGLGCVSCRALGDDSLLDGGRCLFLDRHEGYHLCHCRQCGQPFLKQFHEILDWKEGKDDLWRRWLPLAPEELAEVERLFPFETEDAANVHVLAALMHRRRRLTQHPDGQFFWAEDGWDAGDLLPPG